MLRGSDKIYVREELVILCVREIDYKKGKERKRLGRRAGKK
jgi:hypothetical protein